MFFFKIHDYSGMVVGTVKGGRILQMENPKPEIIPGKFDIWLSAKCRTIVTSDIYQDELP